MVGVVIPPSAVIFQGRLVPSALRMLSRCTWISTIALPFSQYLTRVTVPRTVSTASAMSKSVLLIGHQWETGKEPPGAAAQGRRYRPQGGDAVSTYNSISSGGVGGALAGGAACDIVAPGRLCWAPDAPVGTREYPNHAGPSMGRPSGCFLGCLSRSTCIRMSTCAVRLANSVRVKSDGVRHSVVGSKPKARMKFAHLLASFWDIMAPLVGMGRKSIADAPSNRPPTTRSAGRNWFKT